MGYDINSDTKKEHVYEINTYDPHEFIFVLCMAITVSIMTMDV